MATRDITDAQVVAAYDEAKRLRFKRWPYEILAAQTGQPEKVCFRAMERAEKRGLVEYGTSLRSGWLTDEGRELLASK